MVGNRFEKTKSFVKVFFESQRFTLQITSAFTRLYEIVHKL